MTTEWYDTHDAITGEVLPEDYPELYDILVEAVPQESKHYKIPPFKLPAHYVDRVILPVPVTLRAGDTLTINYTMVYTEA